jgi:hypothetical protein
MSLCVLAYAQPEEPLPKAYDNVEMLKIDYRNAKTRGDAQDAIRILREIVRLLPRDSDWRFRLSEEMLQAGQIEGARDCFLDVIQLEPDYLEAGIGVARTFALQGRDEDAKVELLRWARKGYPVASMMKRQEFREYMLDYGLVLKLLEADKPTAEAVRDPFENPLRRKSVEPGEPDGPGKKKEPVKGKLTLEKQRDMVREAADLAVALQEALVREDTDKAIEFYKRLEEIFARRDDFTNEDFIAQLDATCAIVKRQYQRIEKLIRERTLREAGAQLDALFDAVRKQDRARGHDANGALLAIIRESLNSRDEKLKEAIGEIDTRRAELFKTVEILDRFDSEVRPRLVLKGTITGTGRQEETRAFFDIRTPEGMRGVVVTEGGQMPFFENLSLEGVQEDGVSTSFEGVAIGLEMGGEPTAAP